jgi:hypothetical protein
LIRFKEEENPFLFLNMRLPTEVEVIQGRSECPKSLSLFIDIRNPVYRQFTVCQTYFVILMLIAMNLIENE